MKRLLIVLFVLPLLFACSDDEEGTENNIDPVFGTDLGGVTFSCYKQNKLSTGELTEEPVNVIVYIWSADGRDFDFTKSTQADVAGGYLWDNKTGKSIKADYAKLSTNFFTKHFKKGKYLIYVNMGNKVPRFAWSYTFFDVKYKQEAKLKKVFSYDAKGLTQEDW